MLRLDIGLDAIYLISSSSMPFAMDGTEHDDRAPKATVHWSYVLSK